MCGWRGEERGERDGGQARGADARAPRACARGLRTEVPGAPLLARFLFSLPVFFACLDRTRHLGVMRWKKPLSINHY